MSQSNTSSSANDSAPRKLPLKDNYVGQGLILCAMALIGMGVIMVASAMTSLKTADQHWLSRVDAKQVIFAAGGCFILMFFWRMNYAWLAKGKKMPWLTVGLLFIALAMAGLVYVPGLGHAVGGKYRWIRIAGFQFQPSEILKLVAVSAVCVILTRPGVNIKSPWTVLLAGLMIIISAGAVIKEDFGTAVIIAISGTIAMFIAGVAWYWFAVGIPAGVAGGYYLMINASYRMDRWKAMKDPWDLTNQASFHPRQSILAILSGDWTGAGLGGGIRKMGFLPEDTTDFIFAIICEETGLIGAGLLLMLFAGILWLSFSAARSSRDELGRVLASSLGAMIVLQAGMHVAVNLNLLPPTGIALPFISAGGSGIIIMSLAMAMIVSISARPAEDEHKLECI